MHQLTTEELSRVMNLLSSSLTCMHAKSLQSCPTLCGPTDYSLPGSSVHRILQARILEWVAILFSRGSSRPRDWTQVSCIAGRFFTIRAMSEAPKQPWALAKFFCSEQSIKTGVPEQLTCSEFYQQLHRPSAKCSIITPHPVITTLWGKFTPRVKEGLERGHNLPKVTHGLSVTKLRLEDGSLSQTLAGRSLSHINPPRCLLGLHEGKEHIFIHLHDLTCTNSDKEGLSSIVLLLVQM